MRKLFFILIYLFVSFVCFGQITNPTDQSIEELYADLSRLVGIDPNTGTTVFPILQIPAGGKFQSLSTAFTATADDISFIEANPAGSSRLEYTGLSATHNQPIAHSSLENVLYTARFDHLGIGFSGKHVSLTFIEYGGDSKRTGASGVYSETVAAFNLSYNFLYSYYFHGLSVGANFKVVYRHVPEIVEPKQSAFGFLGDIGFLTRFNFLKPYVSRSRNFAIGAKIKNYGPDVLDEALPTHATVGIAYSPIRPVTISADYNHPFHYLSPFGLDQNKTVELPTYAVGIDLAFAPVISVQTGASFKIQETDPLSGEFSLPDLRWTMGFSLQPRDDLTINGSYTLSLGSNLREFNNFSIEVVFNLGDMGRKAKQAKVETLYLEGMQKYANGELEEAVELWEEVVELDPTYLPAKDIMETVKKAVELQKELEELQQIENE